MQRSLAVLLQDSGDAPAAARITADNTRRPAELYGAEDGEAALDQSFRVIPLCLTGRIAEGLAAARDSVRMASGLHGLPEPDRRGLERRLGLALLFDGRFAESLSLLQRLAEADERDGFNDGREAATLVYLPAALSLRGQPQAAAERAAEAATIWRRHATLTSQTLAGRALLAQSLALAQAGQAGDAQARLDQGLALLKPRLPAGHVLLRSAELVRAAVLRAQGQAAAALALERDTQTGPWEAGYALPASLPWLP
ncbi:hypothetical protein BH11PSE10_BH11PSE10_03180 [soil metagenome]